MKASIPKQSEGAVMVLAVSVLALLLLSLGGVLSVSLARRQRVRTELLNDLADVEARSILLNLKSAMASQIRQTGSFDVAQFRFSSPDTRLGPSAAAVSSVFERSVQWTGDSAIAATPSLGTNAVVYKDDFLEGVAHQPAGRFNVSYQWEAKTPTTNRAQMPNIRRMSTSITADQVPLSAFTFYSSALKTVAGGEQEHLGRAYTEGDLIVAACVDTTAPIICAGSLSIRPEACAVIQRGNPTEARAFGATHETADLQSQGRGWVLDRDSHPVLLVRPVTTAELFSKDPLPQADKEKHRLKPQCELIVAHSSDPEGRDVFTFGGRRGATITDELHAAIQRNSSSLEIDLSKLPSGAKWPSKIWIETTHPNITTVLVKNAENLAGDLSLATSMHIKISGSFNTETPLKRASLMTMGRVVSVP